MQRGRLDGADRARAVAMRALLGRGLEQAGAQALARQLKQAERRDVAELNARTVELGGFLDALLDGGVVAPLLHVDEVDHDQAGEIAQAELATDFVSGLQIGLQRGLFDVALTGGAAGVHVDRDQRLGRVDHDVAAGLQLNRGAVDRVELRLNLITVHQRHDVAILLHLLGVAGHQHLHEGLGDAVAFVALDQHFVDVAGVEVADRALDQVALGMDHRGRGRFQRQFADVVPESDQIFIVASDFGLAALHARSAHDDRHALGNPKLVEHSLQSLAIDDAADLAADAAAARGVGHQHAVAAGERYVGRERRAFVAALLLHHLHQHDLAACDHFLDLVAAQPARATRAILSLFAS